MTADPPKKRKWFQIHLITACVLMLVASYLVYLGVRLDYTMYWTTDKSLAIGNNQFVQYDLPPKEASPDELYGRKRAYGWPVPLYSIYDGVMVKNGTWTRDTTIQARESFASIKFFIFDALLAAFAILSTAVTLEYLIRRRERTRQEPRP